MTPIGYILYSINKRIKCKINRYMELEHIIRRSIDMDYKIDPNDAVECARLHAELRRILVYI